MDKPAKNKSTGAVPRAAFTAMTAAAIRKSATEFDLLTRTTFLEKYGYGQAKEYFLNIGGRRYDSKAIVGAAAKFLPEVGRPLFNNEFSGGEHQVQKLLGSVLN